MVLPNFTTQDPATYKASIDATAADHDSRITANENQLADHNQLAGAFIARQADTPDMTFKVSAGILQYDITLINKAEQAMSALTAPITDPRIDRVVIDELTGTSSVIAGAEAVSPVPPALTAGKIAIAKILLTVSMTEITDSDISNERAVFRTAEVLDEDDMASDDDTKAPTQQSVKKYVDNAAQAILSVFTSTEQTITTASLLTIPHGLGVYPEFLRTYAVCKTAEFGYAVGDRLEVLHGLTQAVGSSETNISLRADTENIYLIYGNSTNPITAIRADTANGAALTKAKWRIVVKAFG